MYSFRSPIFIVCSILFLMHQLLQHVFSINITLADSYLDNILAMPVLLTILVAERRLLFNKGKCYHLSILEVFFATTYVALVSEFLFPILSPRFTFDWWDLLFYFAGAGIFLSSTRSS